MISETDLIVKDNNIYHINVNKDNVAETIILVGDQDRVSMISKYFDRITHKSQHREFVVHTGYIGKKYLTVMSTGIGCDNIDIVVNELDAIFNIDLKTREIKKDLTSLNLIRLGTCGTIRKDIPVDSIIVSDYGLGLDNLLSFYKGGNAFYRSAYKWNDDFCDSWNPYIVEGDYELRNLFAEHIHGITATSPGFYAPQGRNLRIKQHEHDSLIKDLSKLSYKKSKVVNFEMETSALYGLAKLSGHKALTLCTVVANRITKEFTKDGEKSVDNLIQTFLNKIV
jgi:uridine phosphorylase